MSGAPAVWALVALIAGVVVALAVAAVVLTRRRRARTAAAAQAALVAPQQVPDYQFDVPEASVWPTTYGGTRGSGTTDLSWEQSALGDHEQRGVPESQPPKLGYSFEDLMRRPTDEPASRRLDPREMLALEQKTRIQDADLAWRRTGRPIVRAAGEGEEVLLFGRVVSRTSSETGFDQLVRHESSVLERLGPDAERIDLGWPRQPALNFDGGVNGYFVPALDESYVLTVPRRGSVVRTLRAVNGLNDAAIDVLEPGEILELMRLVAVWLDALHEAGVVFGDLDHQSLAFATNPLRLRVLDYDTARLLGRASLLPTDPDGERDSLAPGDESSYDSDRFLFAQLSFRLMVSRTANAQIAPEAVPARLLGLDEQRTDRLRQLWRRAAGPWGTRPTMQEWAAALRPAAVGGATTGY